MDQAWEHINLIKTLELIAGLMCDDQCQEAECSVCPTTNDEEHDSFLHAVKYAKTALANVGISERGKNVPT